MTRASGLRQVVLARAVGNRRLSTACHLWAFASFDEQLAWPAPSAVAA
jgi:hypothetical protein